MNVNSCRLRLKHSLGTNMALNTDSELIDFLEPSQAAAPSHKKNYTDDMCDAYETLYANIEN